MPLMLRRLRQCLEPEVGVLAEAAVREVAIVPPVGAPDLIGVGARKYPFRWIDDNLLGFPYRRVERAGPGSAVIAISRHRDEDGRRQAVGPDERDELMSPHSIPL